MPSRMTVEKPVSEKVIVYRAGPQIDEAVTAFAVRHDAADFFDEGGARGLHRNAGHRQSRAVADDADDS